MCNRADEEDVSQVGHGEALQQGWELVFEDYSKEDMFFLTKISECLTILR